MNILILCLLHTDRQTYIYIDIISKNIIQKASCLKYLRSSNLQTVSEKIRGYFSLI